MQQKEVSSVNAKEHISHVLIFDRASPCRYRLQIISLSGFPTQLFENNITTKGRFPTLLPILERQ